MLKVLPLASQRSHHVFSYRWLAKMSGSKVEGGKEACSKRKPINPSLKPREANVSFGLLSPPPRYYLQRFRKSCCSDFSSNANLSPADDHMTPDKQTEENINSLSQATNTTTGPRFNIRNHLKHTNQTPQLGSSSTLSSYFSLVSHLILPPVTEDRSRTTSAAPIP